jgi:shikimate dehydrogenase
MVADHHIIVNCTPLGTYPNVDTCPPIPYEGIGFQHYLYDLVYNPSRTKFLQQGQKAGAIVENGAGMLSIQADAAWQIWNS